MIRLYCLSYSEFFYSFPCSFVHCSVIYHCFSHATYTGPFPFFVPLFVSLQSSHPFSSIHSICIFQLVFGFSFPIPPVLFTLSCPLKSPSKSIRSSLCFSIPFSCRFSLIPNFTPPVVIPFSFSLFAP
ncbi:unnamed protein product [Tenebrio molitor]|nr:unnamed protein product [Tenebrio molitor]